MNIQGDYILLYQDGEKIGTHSDLKTFIESSQIYKFLLISLRSYLSARIKFSNTSSQNINTMSESLAWNNIPKSDYPILVKKINGQDTTWLLNYYYTKKLGHKIYCCGNDMKELLQIFKFKLNSGYFE